MLESARLARPLLAACLALTLAAVLGPASATAREQVVGGSRASMAEHGYAVYLTTVDGFQYCGGTLARPHKVITAAHCVDGRSPAEIEVVAGREDRASTAGIVAGVDRIWVHPDYRDYRSGADLAVLTLDVRLPYRTLRPARPKDRLYQAGTPATVLGWGRTSLNGPTSRYLLQAEVPLVSAADCGQAYPDYDARTMVCAGLDEGGVDTCQGDSGGPLIVAGRYGKRLAGIASWGSGCALPGRPGVYTKVARFHEEIAEELASDAPRLGLLSITP